MNTKTIFKTLAVVMLMPALLLTTACSSDDDFINNPENNNKKGYALPVTVNVTREDDGTRATYNESTKKLSFSTGDQLFVKGFYDDVVGNFAGTLEWQSEGTFSGTIYIQNAYSSTAKALLAGATLAYAVLLPSGYESYGYLGIQNEGYNAGLQVHKSDAFAATKAAAVEQFSFEMAMAFSSSDGFALSPDNAILNFTIAGLTANATGVAVALTGAGDLTISKTVTANASGKATFAVGVNVAQNDNLSDLSLTVGGKAITLGEHALEAGHVYNVTRSTLTYPITLSAVTSPYIGSVVTSDGYVYQNKSGAEAAGKTVVAMIAYVGNRSNCTHGLAIQINSNPPYKTWDEAKSYAAGLPAVSGGTWRLASNADWQNMFLACRIDGDASSAPSSLDPINGTLMGPIEGFREKIEATGIAWISDYIDIGCWSSTDTEAGSNNAWSVIVDLDYSPAYAAFLGDGKKYDEPVRGCLAF